MSRPTTVDSLTVAVRLLSDASDALDYAGRAELARKAGALYAEVVAERQRWETPASEGTHER